MTPTQRKAMEQALADMMSFEAGTGGLYRGEFAESITALRAALAMIETPTDMIKSILLKHEEAAIEVMSELHQQQQKDEALLRQALEALSDIREATAHSPKVFRFESLVAKLKDRLL